MLSPEMVAALVSTLILILDLVIKVVAVGLVPENRHPSSSTTWLLVILLVPFIGLPLFLLLGSSRVTQRRHGIQAQANQLFQEHLGHLPSVPAGIDLVPGLDSIVELNRRLTSLPALMGTNDGLCADYNTSIQRIAASVDTATHHVHVEIFIMAWDETTDVFFTALTRAAARGVQVRVLLDHLGSRKYPGFSELINRLSEAGIEAHLMLPIKPLQRRWRRPDLRNHRKLVVVDGRAGHMGSQNMIDASYLVEKNLKHGRRYQEVTIDLSGPIVSALEAVFAVDWYTETDQRLGPSPMIPLPDSAVADKSVNVFQLVPSGPGFDTTPNLRLFISLIHSAQHRISIVSPYFVPDEALLAAITTASYRGVQVELFVSETADQFMVGHAQRSYYDAILTAGVHIYQYPWPAILHSKFFTVDDSVGILGSSNMDMRSFGLNYEISLMATGGDVPAGLLAIVENYKSICAELTREEWTDRPVRLRYLDNVMRMTSALQ